MKFQQLDIQSIKNIHNKKNINRMTTTLWNQYIKDISNIIITTDLETDDLIALLILVEYIPKDANISFVVGEGNATMKYYRMTEYVKLMGSLLVE